MATEKEKKLARKDWGDNDIKTNLTLILFVFFFQANVRSLCAVNLFQVLDKKIGHDCYASQEVCAGLEVCNF